MDSRFWVFSTLFSTIIPIEHNLECAKNACFLSSISPLFLFLGSEDIYSDSVKYFAYIPNLFIWECAQVEVIVKINKMVFTRVTFGGETKDFVSHSP